jgi:lipopolysaccharide transport system permease protein
VSVDARSRIIIERRWMTSSTTPAGEVTQAPAGKRSLWRGRYSPRGASASTPDTARRIRIDSRRKWFPDLREFFRSWDLLVLLSRRQITVRYRQTVLGVAWVVITPLLSAGLFTFVFGGVANLSAGGVPYFAFSYAGLLGWNLFATTLTGASSSLTVNAPLISKIYFPRLVLPLSTLAVALIQLGISLCVMSVLLIVYGIGFSAHLLLLPVWLLLATVLGTGIGLILAAISVAYRDINQATPVLVQLFMYLTPVAYATADVPSSVRNLFLLNPMTTVIEGCRWSLLGEAYMSPWAIAYTILATIGSLIAGLLVFARLEWNFADVI